MLRNTALATPAMLASQRLSVHTGNAKIIFIELPCFKELSDNSSLLIPASKFRYVPRVLNHGEKIEIGREGKEDGKKKIEKRVRRVRI